MSCIDWGYPKNIKCAGCFSNLHIVINKVSLCKENRILTLPLQKVLQQLQACFVAFFGVKLYGEYVVFAENAGKIVRIFAGAEHDVAVLRCKVIAVNKIKMCGIAYACKQGVRLRLADGVPAHVRHFQAIALRVGLVGGKTLDAAFEPAQTCGIAFFTVFKQQLCAHANAKKGFVFQRFLHSFAQTALVERVHAVGHCALTWEDDFVGR